MTRASSSFVPVAEPLAAADAQPHPRGADLAAVQGLLYSAWADHPWAAFLFATLGETRHSQAWLRHLTPRVTAAAPESRPANHRLAVALSPRGLAALGVPREVISQLPHEALMGMRARARVLGDAAPLDWTLGGQDELHVLLMLYAKDRTTRDELVDEQRRALQHAGARLLPVELSTALGERGNREHFGFVDGISQPFLQGLHAHARDGSAPIPAGELVLGYPNAYGRLPHSPRWDSFDLGKHGSYLVFRKLEQHVERFWGYCTERARALAPTSDPSDPAVHALAERLAAKMMGRWKSGASLVLAPHHDDPAALAPERINTFGYAAQDADGLRCPISAHVRRANPRDARGSSITGSLTVTARHRILRRGRTYGPPLPDELARAGRGDGQTRGLYFLCLQTSLARGFEFIQQSWLGNPGFGGMFQESDPIAGPGDCPFTIPEEPVRLRLPPAPPMVTMRGGGYFFLPSLPALERIAAG